ncbi:MAG: LysR family transcriptional regulator [Actinomycetales bacterium]
MDRSEYRDLVALLPLLPVLIDVADTGHVGQTADRLGLPQSTVSRALARAGAAVGVDLLVRQGRGIRLTAAARALVPELAAAVQAVQSAVDGARRQGGQPRGLVRIAFQHTFGEAALPLLIRLFSGRYPHIRFELLQGARSVCLEALAEHRVDLVLTAPVPPSGRGTAAQPLYAEPLRLVVPEHHRLARRKSVALAEVQGDGFVVLSEGYGLRGIFDALARQSGFRPRITFEGQDSHTLRGLDSAGLGVSVLPASGVDHLTPRQSGLGWRELPLADAGARREIGLGWRNGSAEPAPVALFRDLVLGEGRVLLDRALGSGLHGGPDVLA